MIAKLIYKLFFSWWCGDSTASPVAELVDSLRVRVYAPEMIDPAVVCYSSATLRNIIFMHEPEPTGVVVLTASLANKLIADRNAIGLDTVSEVINEAPFGSTPLGYLGGHVIRYVSMEIEIGNVANLAVLRDGDWDFYAVVT